jgi:hypothetical protein
MQARDIEARGIHVSVCTNRKPGKPDKALRLRVPKVNQPRPVRRFPGAVRS